MDKATMIDILIQSIIFYTELERQYLSTWAAFNMASYGATISFYFLISNVVAIMLTFLEGGLETKLGTWKKNARTLY